MHNTERPRDNKKDKKDETAYQCSRSVEDEAKFCEKRKKKSKETVPLSPKFPENVARNMHVIFKPHVNLTLDGKKKSYACDEKEGEFKATFVMVIQALDLNETWDIRPGLLSLESLFGDYVFKTTYKRAQVRVFVYA